MYIEILLQFVAIVLLTLHLPLALSRSHSVLPLVLDYTRTLHSLVHISGGYNSNVLCEIFRVDGKCNAHDEYNVWCRHCCCCCFWYRCAAIDFVIAIIITDDELRFFSVRSLSPRFSPRFIIVCVVRLTCCVRFIVLFVDYFNLNFHFVTRTSTICPSHSKEIDAQFIASQDFKSVRTILRNFPKSKVDTTQSKVIFREFHSLNFKSFRRISCKLCEHLSS